MTERTKPEGAALAVKILAVMADVEEVAKDSLNAFHKYKYASDAAIITAVRVAMIKHRLIAIPDQKACVFEPSEKEGGMTTITVEYTLIDADSGESTKAVVHGQGKDSGDKGAYKAATGAEKYFFLKTFLIPTTDDPEGNGNSEKKTLPFAKSAPAAKPAPSVKPAAKSEPEKKLSPKELNDCQTAARIVDEFNATETLEALEVLGEKHKPQIDKFNDELKAWTRGEYISSKKRFPAKPAATTEGGK